MLDVNDFLKDKGGDPEKIRESQRRRSAPVEAVDEVIALYEDHRKSELLCSNGIGKLSNYLFQHNTPQPKSRPRSMRSKNKLAQRERRRRAQMMR